MGQTLASPFAFPLPRPAMNVHHLELFYYVAKHGGISAAVRQIPYGIQQPAVSSQIRALEENAGAVLFERSPFRLTPAGEKLFLTSRPSLKTWPRWPGTSAVVRRRNCGSVPRNWCYAITSRR